MPQPLSEPSVVLSVRVQPRASRNAVLLRPDGSLKVYLTAPAVEGAANRALIETLAERLRLPRHRFEIASGKTSRDKRLRIMGLDRAALQLRLQEVSSR